MLGRLEGGAACLLDVSGRVARAQAVACIGVIIAGGRALLRPICRRMGLNPRCSTLGPDCRPWPQAVACIGVIIAGGRTLLRPIYRRMADMGNTDVFAATTLLVVLGTSVLTQIAGLSLALGAFLVRARAALSHPCARRCLSSSAAQHVSRCQASRQAVLAPS